jgi:hypothetical protein
MSDRDEPGLDELERQLDATFASARPRRGFEDELWRRLEARRPWWGRLRMPSAGAVAGLTGGLVALLAVGLVTVVVLRGGMHMGAASGASTTTAAPASRSGGAAASGQFGQLPAPSGAVSAKVPRADGAGIATTRPAGPFSLPVYRYDKASGPATGQVFDPTKVPSGLLSADYPAEPGSGRLVYVAVPDPTGPYGYLEPEYMASDTSSLVPALAPSAYRG